MAMAEYCKMATFLDSLTLSGFILSIVIMKVSFDTSAGRQEAVRGETGEERQQKLLWKARTNSGMTLLFKE